MKYLAITLMSALFFLTGCSKDDGLEACERNKTGDIVFSNSNDSPYTCYVNGVPKGTVTGYGIITIKNIDADRNVSVRALQQSGYIFYPSDFTNTIYLNSCDSQTFSF